MISRQTTLALAFACLATLSVTVVAEVQRPAPVAHAAAPQVQVIELPRVVVTGKVNREARP